MNFNWRNFNWRDRLIRNIPIDEVVEKISGLGIPGLVLLMAISSSGLTGGAAIVAALAFLGGPLGMLGGIGALGVLAFIAAALSKFGFNNLFKTVLNQLKEQGKTKEEILQEIDRYPIARGLRLRLRDYIENMEYEETDEGEEARLSELSERAQEIFSIIEPLVDNDFEQLESRLNKKIDDVNENLNNRMNRSETKLKWFISIAVAVGGIITSGIVALIVHFAK